MAKDTDRYAELLTEIQQFQKVIDAATLPDTDGARRVPGIAHAAAVSEASDRLKTKLLELRAQLFETHGRSVTGSPPGFTMMGRNSRDEPWQVIPSKDVASQVVEIGGKGADASLMAVVDSVLKVTDFNVPPDGVIDRENLPRQRWRVGDVIPAEAFHHLDSAAKLLRLRGTQEPATGRPLSKLDDFSGETMLPEVIAHLKSQTQVAPRPWVAGETPRTRSKNDAVEYATTAHQAFDAAGIFLEHAKVLVEKARNFNPSAPMYRPGTSGHILGHNEYRDKQGLPRLPGDWPKWGTLYGEAFVAWVELFPLLTPDVRKAAARVYPPASAQIKFGNTRTMSSVIEAVAYELGPAFRNVLYADRPHPLEPRGGETVQETRARLGIVNVGDAQRIIAEEWQRQSEQRISKAINQIRFRSIDFDSVVVMLGQEAQAVLDQERAAVIQLTSSLSAPTPPSSPTRSDGAPPNPPMAAEQLLREKSPNELVKAVQTPIGPAGSLSAPAVLRDEHITILMDLASRSVPVIAQELAGKSGMPGYDKLLDMLKELENRRLVSRPFGRKSGFVIEPAGRSELRDRGLSK